jgi:hypothetical protein
MNLRSLKPGQPEKPPVSKIKRGTVLAFAVWAITVVLLGGVLTSYHQPFQTPDANVLTLVGSVRPGRWRTVHILSGSCGCSQTVMQHLLKRHLFAGLDERILVVDSGEAYLPGSDALLAKLSQQGFPITHIAAKDIPDQVGLRGVPILVIASSENKISYMGGYGSHGDQDAEILQQVQSGQKPKVLPVLGCAVGERARREADPLQLKY